MTDPLYDILKQFWGFDSFRPFQEDIIRSVLENNDTLALMPTGGGKSMCYQIPALAKDGICLVVSPLIALMKDQVQQLRKRNITAYSIYSGMRRKDVIQTLKTVIESNCKFLYVSPERLESPLFKEFLPGMHINLVAIDEAHCISQWGYDFRPPYLRIAALREELPGVPFLALTASATPDVQEDICNKLSVGKPWKVFRQSFLRPNLSYSAFIIDSKINKIVDILKNVEGSAIIYCRSRKRTKEISELLQMQGIVSDYYHAGLGRDERSTKQEDWIDNRKRVIVCTNAFGMGIDKPDVRTVIHADIPDCLESYYQEAGRAGRDGKKAYAILLYDNEDIRDLDQMAAQRFPTIVELRKIYQSVANYLQVPAGDGEGQYYDFDINDFIKKFKLASTAASYGLKALEQEGWMSFNEQVFLPSSVEFIVNKKALYEFEKNYPALEPLVKTLLRSYEGIFDHSTWISETVLAGLLHFPSDEIIKQLSDLARLHIIEYHPQKDKPQVYLTRNRVRTEDLSIDQQSYSRRREKFQKRVKEMSRYSKEELECRSSFLASYLGEKEPTCCGICDNCLRRKKMRMTKDEFESIHRQLVLTMKKEVFPAKELLQSLPSIDKEKAWKVIEFLVAERKMEMDGLGRIKMM